MKYYIIAGEASGDLHGSNLIREIGRLDKAADIRCWGGDRMASAGGELVKHYRELAYMGFGEVITNLRTILRNIRFCKQDILRFRPDVLVLIDYPGFNLRIAEFAKKKALKVVYYISPQVWAWKSSRVKKIKKYVDKMLVILPFEQAFYRQWDYEVEFVGHPLLDAIVGREKRVDFFKEEGLPEQPLIAVLPGSRKQEIAQMLPVIAGVIKAFPDYRFVVAGVSSVGAGFYEGFMQHQRMHVVMDRTYDLLQYATAAIVTSGTATLETALFEVPQIVGYKGSPFSFFIGRLLVNVKYISLVNLIADKIVVKELIQSDLTKANLTNELQRLLEDEQYRTAMLGDYQALKKQLGGTGASARAASSIVNAITEPS